MSFYRDLPGFGFVKLQLGTKTADSRWSTVTVRGLKVPEDTLIVKLTKPEK